MIQTDTISREDFKAIITAVLDADGVGAHFTPADLLRLEHFANTAKQAAYGSWKNAGVACPITGCYIPRFSGAEIFANMYDERVRSWLNPLWKEDHGLYNEGILKIVD
jgi:hypothetical protein